MTESTYSGARYLRSLRRSELPFDEISVGGVWLNEFVIDLVWRAAVATPEVPQVTSSNICDTVIPAAAASATRLRQVERSTLRLP